MVARVFVGKNTLNNVFCNQTRDVMIVQVKDTCNIDNGYVDLLSWEALHPFEGTTHLVGARVVWSGGVGLYGRPPSPYKMQILPG
jgi:hypothetical protein